MRRFLDARAERAAGSGKRQRPPQAVAGRASGANATKATKSFWGWLQSRPVWLVGVPMFLPWRHLRDDHELAVSGLEQRCLLNGEARALQR